MKKKKILTHTSLNDMSMFHWMTMPRRSDTSASCLCSSIWFLCIHVPIQNPNPKKCTTFSMISIILPCKKHAKPKNRKPCWGSGSFFSSRFPQPSSGSAIPISILGWKPRGSIWGTKSSRCAWLPPPCSYSILWIQFVEARVCCWNLLEFPVLSVSLIEFWLFEVWDVNGYCSAVFFIKCDGSDFPFCLISAVILDGNLLCYYLLNAFHWRFNWLGIDSAFFCCCLFEGSIMHTTTIWSTLFRSVPVLCSSFLVITFVFRSRNRYLRGCIRLFPLIL